MLDADMNARYWKYLVSRYVQRDRALKVFLALMASGAVAGWGLWIAVPWLWKTLSSISAVVAIALPVLNYQTAIEKMSSLAGKWGELRIEYEDLWLQVRNHPDPNLLELNYRKSREIEASLQAKEADLPSNLALLRKCVEEVKRARGLR